jgi:hypothetical protein
MTPLSFLQRDYRTCEKGYELSVFGQVEGRERKREHGKKKNSKTFFFPYCTSRGRRRTMLLKTTSFRASPPFF